MPIGIIGLGDHLPARVVTNAEVAGWTGATEDWIRTGTGVEERRYAADTESTADLAAAAARQALEPGLRERLAAIVLATSTPDQPQPATAALVQQRLELPGVPAFDLNAVCPGFLYALTVAEALLARRDPAATALVIGADRYSTIMNRQDRRTVSLFGDGAGAVVLGAVPEGYGLHATHLHTDGHYSDLIEVPSRSGLFSMNGFAVREYVMTRLPEAVHAVLEEAGMKLGEVDRFVFHQANTRLVTACAEALGVPPEKVPITATRCGNTAAASVPITLAASHRERPLRRGERILLAAVGGGLSTAAALLTWY